MSSEFKKQRDDTLAKARSILDHVKRQLDELQKVGDRIRDEQREIRDQIEKLKREDEQRGSVPRRWQSIVTHSPPLMLQ